jgi:hypothetical protein
MNTKSFNWSTEFKSIIIVDNELFHNTYKIKIGIRPVTADLEEQSQYFDRLKFLYTYVIANTIITWRDEPLYEILEKRPTTDSYNYQNLPMTRSWRRCCSQNPTRSWKARSSWTA